MSDETPWPAASAPLVAWPGTTHFVFLAGALLSLLGFALPWFRVNRG